MVLHYVAPLGEHSQARSNLLELLVGEQVPILIPERSLAGIRPAAPFSAHPWAASDAVQESAAVLAEILPGVFRVSPPITVWLRDAERAAKMGMQLGRD